MSEEKKSEKKFEISPEELMKLGPYQQVEYVLEKLGYSKEEIERFKSFRNKDWRELTDEDKDFMFSVCEKLRQVLTWDQIANYLNKNRTSLINAIKRWRKKKEEEKYLEQYIERRIKELEEEATSTSKLLETSKPSEIESRQIGEKVITDEFRKQVAKEVARKEVALALDAYKLIKQYLPYAATEGISLIEFVRKACDFYIKYKDVVPDLEHRLNIYRSLLKSLLLTLNPVSRIIIERIKLEVYTKALGQLAVLERISPEILERIERYLNDSLYSVLEDVKNMMGGSGESGSSENVG